MTTLALSIPLVALIAALWYRDRRRWTGHVRRIDAALARIEEGDWRARVAGAADGAPAPVAGLAGRVDRLAARTGKQIAALDRQRGDLRALVDALPDPILLADTRGKIILLNAPAAGLIHVGLDAAMHQPLVNVVHDAAVLALFEQVGPATGGTGGDAGGAPPEPLHRTVRLTRGGVRRSYQAVATRTQAGGVLVVLRDVSQLAGAVQMKADFVANASHELRTPLSAIKIAFETLVEVARDDPTQAERCMEIIAGHLSRLEEMLRDLMDLSRVEMADLKPHLEAVRAADLLASLRATLGPVARQKGVELHFADADGMSVVTDRRLLDLIAKNLVENGVKYTPAGGRVTVTLDRRALPADAAAAHVHLTGDGAYHEVVLGVADTGIGIPPDHLDRVFERFYQVDPARSGSAGRGTGLGLAIVKHAAAALGASVRIDSAVGRGTTVTCTLPQTAPPPPLSSSG